MISKIEDFLFITIFWNDLAARFFLAILLNFKYYD